MTHSKPIAQLIHHGVAIASPESVEVGRDLDHGRIADQGVCIHSGSRICGAETFIASGAQIGTEGPVTIDNCYVGPDVELKSGYFKNAVFLEKASLGYGAHVREGTILEEQASTAHCVGLKQTILMPFVALGSLINFCDVLMAGGTSRKNHSEVGSSFIHFNYTPGQDKATPSLLGEVPNGVMLNQRPIFMGGQGGLVGPCRIAYGTVSAAGTIVRKDQLKPDHLVFGGRGKGGSIPWKPGSVGVSRRIIRNNRIYIANLIALREWYHHVRRMFISERFPEPLWQGLLTTLDMGISERFKRLFAYVEKIGDREQINLTENWGLRYQTPKGDPGDLKLRDTFLKRLTTFEISHKTYLETITSLPDDIRQGGTQWLQSIVMQIAS